MKWYVNDCSLNGQYPDAAAFICDLNNLMKARARWPILERNIHCSRQLHTLQVTQTLDFRTALSSQKNPVLTRLVLSWLTKLGPFWEDSREFNEDDYFELNGVDVTNTGLAEAARCQLSGRNATTVSFARAGFDYSPIDVEHGLPEEPIGRVQLLNIWDFNILSEAARAHIPTPVNWEQMLEQAKMQFDRLTFSPLSISALRKEPFSTYVVERVYALLGVLQDFMNSLNGDGTYSNRSHELIATHFAGEKAWFTDESDTNKNAFRDEMTFSDPERNGEQIYCPWHGKIKTPQYRVHFEWPLPAGPNLRVFYIGPKITKK